MKRKGLAIVIGTVMGLWLGAPSFVAGQEQGVTESIGQPMGSEQPARDFMNMTASELKGETIYNSSGDKLGTVDSVVTDQSRQLHIVLSVGGFLGLGQTNVVVPLSQLNRTDERISTDSPVSTETLLESARYNADAYNEISEDIRLADAVRGAEQPGSAAVGGRAIGEELAGFQDLDIDGNGFISRQEAGSSVPIMNNWPLVDLNSDGQIDEAEFSAFEAGYDANAGEMRESMTQPRSRQQPEAGSLQEQSSFHELDRNDDGYISENEADNHESLPANWEQADANGDGHVDQAEFAAFERLFGPERPTQRQRPQDRTLPRIDRGREQAQ